jgi:hypothetical protein
MFDRQILPYIPVEESPSEGREEMIVYTGPTSLLTHHSDLSWVSTEITVYKRRFSVPEAHNM